MKFNRDIPSSLIPSNDPDQVYRTYEREIKAPKNTFQQLKIYSSRDTSPRKDKQYKELLSGNAAAISDFKLNKKPIPMELLDSLSDSRALPMLQMPDFGQAHWHQQSNVLSTKNSGPVKLTRLPPVHTTKNQIARHQGGRNFI